MSTNDDQCARAACCDGPSTKYWTYRWKNVVFILTRPMCHAFERL